MIHQRYFYIEKRNSTLWKFLPIYKFLARKGLHFAIWQMTSEWECELKKTKKKEKKILFCCKSISNEKKIENSCFFCSHTFIFHFWHTSRVHLFLLKKSIRRKWREENNKFIFEFFEHLLRWDWVNYWGIFLGQMRRLGFEC